MNMLASLFGKSAPEGSTGPTDPAAGAAAGQPAQPSQPAPADPAPAAPTGAEALAALFADSQTTGGEKGAPVLNLTPELLSKATEGINFMTGVTEDMVAKVGQGDTQALIALIQQVGRNSYQQAMLHGSELAGTYAGTRADYAAAQAAKGIRGQVIESQVDVRNLSPAAQGMFKQIAAKVADKNPTASAAEIQAQAMDMMQQLANEFNFSGKKQEESAPKPTDWSTVFGT